jgi:hypothetical protein
VALAENRPVEILLVRWDLHPVAISRHNLASRHIPARPVTANPVSRSQGSPERRGIILGNQAIPRRAKGQLLGPVEPWLATPRRCIPLPADTIRALSSLKIRTRHPALRRRGTHREIPVMDKRRMERAAATVLRAALLLEVTALPAGHLQGGMVLQEVTDLRAALLPVDMDLRAALLLEVTALPAEHPQGGMVLLEVTDLRAALLPEGTVRRREILVVSVPRRISRRLGTALLRRQVVARAAFNQWMPCPTPGRGSPKISAESRCRSRSPGS